PREPPMPPAPPLAPPPTLYTTCAACSSRKPPPPPRCRTRCASLPSHTLSKTSAGSANSCVPGKVPPTAACLGARRNGCTPHLKPPACRSPHGSRSARSLLLQTPFPSDCSDLPDRGFESCW